MAGERQYGECAVGLESRGAEPGCHLGGCGERSAASWHSRTATRKSKSPTEHARSYGEGLPAWSSSSALREKTALARGAAARASAGRMGCDSVDGATRRGDLPRRWLACHGLGVRVALDSWTSRLAPKPPAAASRLPPAPFLSPAGAHAPLTCAAVGGQRRRRRPLPLLGALERPSRHLPLRYSVHVPT